MSDWMRTFTGGKFYVNALVETKINVEDIAHALSNICRFGGHTKSFYSVAQHSLFVCDIMASAGYTAADQLLGLMHDSAEAYLGDIPTPLKATLPGFADREHMLMKHISRSLKLPPQTSLNTSHAIKGADLTALVTEARQLTHDTADWGAEYHNIRSHPCIIRPMTPREAEVEFLRRYEVLTNRLTSA